MKHINVNQLYPKWLVATEKNESLHVFDVREPGEYIQGHVPGAQLIALNTVPERSDAFPDTGEVYVICRSGMRSSQAIQYLEQHHGHQNLINVTGGTIAWMQAGYPISET